MLEVNEDVTAARKVAGNPPRPDGEPLRRVAVPAQSEIEKGAPAHWPRLRLAVAVNERGAYPLERVGDLRRVPGAVAELVGDPPVARKQGRDPLDPALVEGGGWRELEEDGTQELAEAVGLVGQHSNRFLEIGHAPVVGDAPVGLDGESEFGRHGLDPPGDDLLGLRPIERCVHLDCRQPLRVKAQHLRRLEAPGIETAAPGGIGEPGCPNHELGAHGSSLAFTGWGRP